MKIVHAIEFRHYQDLKPTSDMPAEEQDRLKAEQPPSPQGVLECQKLARIIKQLEISAQAVATSPAMRAVTTAAMVSNLAGWDYGAVKLRELDIRSSDPRVRQMREGVKRLATELGITTNEAMFRHPEGLKYLWEQSPRYLAGLQFACRLLDNDQTLAIFSHGAQIAIRVIRLLWLSKGIQLPEQNMSLIDLEPLKKFGGMLGTCEAFTYDLAVSESGEILLAGDFNSIRLSD